MCDYKASLSSFEVSGCHPGSFKITTDLCMPICVCVCVRQKSESVGGSSSGSKQSYQVSTQPSITSKRCRHHASSPLVSALISRHRDEVVHVQGFLRQGPRRQLRGQDGMLFRRRLQRAPQEPQPRGPPPQPQRRWGSGLQSGPAGRGPAAARGLQSDVNASFTSITLPSSTFSLCLIQSSMLSV